ncbi:MAG: hypothetical protein K6T80_01540 [Firmicutes bacterium]|nr:hypothetical protein [Bacillota bacterium]
MIEAKHKENIVINQAEIEKTQAVITETQNRINANNAEIESLRNLLAARQAALEQEPQQRRWAYTPANVIDVMHGVAEPEDIPDIEEADIQRQIDEHTRAIGEENAALEQNKKHIETYIKINHLG